MGQVMSASNNLLCAGLAGPSGRQGYLGPAGPGSRRAGPVAGCGRPLVCGAGCWRLPWVVLSGGLGPLRRLP